MQFPIYPTEPFIFKPAETCSLEGNIENMNHCSSFLVYDKTLNSEYNHPMIYKGRVCFRKRILEAIMRGQIKLG